MEILTTRPKWRSNVRLMEVGDLEQLTPQWHYRQIAGGMLLQEDDLQADPEAQWQVVTQSNPTST